MMQRLPLRRPKMQECKYTVTRNDIKNKDYNICDHQSYQKGDTFKVDTKKLVAAFISSFR